MAYLIGNCGATEYSWRKCYVRSPAVKPTTNCTIRIIIPAIHDKEVYFPHFAEAKHESRLAISTSYLSAKLVNHVCYGRRRRRKARGLEKSEADLGHEEEWYALPSQKRPFNPLTCCIYLGKQWHAPKKAFRPGSGLTSYAKRAKDREAQAAMKAKEKEIKEDQEEERKVRQTFNMRPT